MQTGTDTPLNDTPRRAAVNFTAWPAAVAGGEQARQVRTGVYGFTFLVVFAGVHRGVGGIGYGLGIAVGIVLLIALWRWLRLRPAQADLEAAEALLGPRDREARVACHGDPPHLARVLAKGALEDVLFEPRVFFGMGAFRASGHQRIAQWIAGVCVLVALVWLEGGYGRGEMGNPYFDIIASVAGGVVLGTLAFPTYVRVVPGRLDVMQCGFLGRSILSRRSIDLRKSRVVIDLSTQVIVHTDGSGTPPIGYAAMWDSAAFANAVLLACMSTHTPPPLPDDALVG
jgi:hypothetical protein